MIKDNEPFEHDGVVFECKDNILHTCLRINNENYGYSCPCDNEWAFEMSRQCVRTLGSCYYNDTMPVRFKYAISVLHKEVIKTIEYQQARQVITSIDGVSEWMREKILNRNKEDTCTITFTKHNRKY